ncbi:MAG TPA: patatin-like phospholipase family protein [Steroidobacteraceae bacterium]|nr:patatin-like phospholipase family protein [Steroidobacteraceae bacterium]
MDATVEAARRPPPQRPTVGLVLTGGGARSAYQVGVLLALTELLPRARNPFPVIVGTSAGAVASCVLAAEAHHWRRAVAGLESVWANFRTSQVFHVSPAHMLRSGTHWLLALLSGGLVLSPPKALLDNSPLRQLLGTRVDCASIHRSITRGHLQGFALCATSYATGQSVAFFDGRESIPEWTRSQRMGRRTELTLDHLMASAAIPLLFPPMCIGREYFGDGAMRQLNPLSPAIHLGADRLLIIGVRARRAAGVGAGSGTSRAMPTPGEVLGYMIDTLFTDQIYGDLEQIDRINQLVHEAPFAARGLRHVDTLMLAPSIDPSEIAGRYTDDIPHSLRALLRVIGGRDVSGYQLASYLMFEAGYTRALIELGYRDAMEARAALLAFMRGERMPPLVTAAGVAQAT